jgi:hypothetical protein
MEQAHGSPARGARNTLIGTNSYKNAYNVNATSWGIATALLGVYRSDVSDSYLRAHGTSTETGTTGTGISPQIQVSNCAIQTAIDNCVGGCKISIPPGTCALTAPLNWAGTGKSINLECAGRDVTVLTWPVGTRGITPDSYSRIAHCTLRGPNVASVGNSIINSGGTTDIVVEDNIIEQSGEDGINTGGDSLHWTIRNNLVRNNIGDGIFLASGTSDSVVGDNVIGANGANGIDCNGSGNTIHGNISKSNGIPGGPIDRNGILISGIFEGSSANYNSVVGNETSYNGGSGITIRADFGTYANYNVVSGNVSHHNGGTNRNGDGIQVDGSDLGTWTGNTIVGNAVFSNQRFGIEVDGQNATAISTTLISSNTSIENGNVGIFLGGIRVTDTLVVNNLAVSNGSAQIADNGTVRAVVGGNKENTSDSLFVIRGDLQANTVTSLGTNPIRLPNGQYIEAQNAAINSQAILLGLDGSNQTILRGGGGPKSIFIQTSSGADGASMTDAGVWNFPGGMTVGRGISSDGSGLKHQSVSTRAIGPGSSAVVTLTWATAFADTNYDPQCSVVDSTASTATVRIHHIQSFTANSVMVRIVNDDRIFAHNGTLYCLGIHQ